MSKSYTLFLNTQNPTNFTNFRPGQGVCDLQFNIDWGSFLPKEYKQFDVTSTLKSVVSGVAFSATCYVQLDIGSGNSYDQSGSQNSITISICPNSYKTGATTKQYFESLANQKGHMQVNRPTNNYLGVKILFSSNGLIASGFPNFTLKLKFTPIE